MRPKSQEDPVVEASHGQLLFLLFGKIGSILCSAAPDFRTEEKLQDWKDRSSTRIDLKMESCTICNKTQPIATELEKGAGPREETRDSSRRQTVCWPLLLFNFTQTPDFPNRPQSMFSIFLWLSKTDLRGSAWFGVNTVFLHLLHLLPEQCRGIWSALCWPSEKLQQTHFIIGWK